ncbi:hypothetical protein ONS95_011233 [Cadophora gregata]|uniref:uncharacterized protein n=1 Tax=Cadophora gregata TaxID=51156 RepID=UPI0026DD7621|nr:uncharacterized protein ONS95_011233 [Cadophora gregata]KAK0119801.1 hypothetical protein ONS95_011233 [Cadophora gregata]KAK0120833.1 hypothetical protein ONS96_011034 [Cadophora gregata f. sp. sojae]
MGKSKPRNRTKSRANPTAKPIADPELAAIRDQRILPVLKDLQSPDLKARSAAARAITNLVEDQKSRKLLLREQIVRILFEQTLTDSNLETRTDGWGILRNLTVEEEPDFCIHLYRQDVLTAIDGVMKTIVQTIESPDVPFAKLPAAQQEILWNLTSSIITLVTSLSEAQEEIAEAISKNSTIITFLFGLLVFSTPSHVQNEVLACLTVLTEDNHLLDQQVVEGDWLKRLLQIKDAEAIDSIAACGVLHNVFVTMKWFDHNTPVEGASDATLIPTLVKYMAHSHPENNGTNGHAPSSSPDQVLQLALEITASIATSLQEALEHGSKNEAEFEGFDESVNGEIEDLDIKDIDEEEEFKDEGSGDEMNQDEIDAEMEMVLGDDSNEEDKPSEEATLGLLVRLVAPQLLSLVRQIQVANSPLQEHALSALNNIAWTISTIDFSTGHLKSLQKSWTAVAQNIWNEIIGPVLASNTADIELASSITSLAWAVARSVKGAIKLKSEEQRKFMALYQASKSLDGASSGQSKAEDDTDAFQGLGVKCIGVLGSLAMDPAPVELNREIGIFLLTTLSALPDVPAADTVEALNQLFDIYADKSYAFDETVFWGDNFSKHLEDIQPQAKKLAKSIDKRKFGELRSRADEAILNLGRFLVYKRKERKEKRENLD